MTPGCDIFSTGVGVFAILSMNSFVIAVTDILALCSVHATPTQLRHKINSDITICDPCL